MHQFAYKLRDQHQVHPWLAVFFVKTKLIKLGKVAGQATFSPLHSISSQEIPQNDYLQIYNEISFDSVTCATDVASSCRPISQAL